MRVIGKDRTGCDACNPLDEIIARIEQLERRVVTIVARVQGIPPDGTGNVTLPTSDSVDGPLYGNIGAFAMSSEVKEATDDVHQYASAIADDVVVLQSDVEILTREVEALDPASVTALEQSVAALQQSVNQLSNTVAGYSAVIGDLEDQLPNKVDRTGDTMTGPLNVIDTATGSRNAQAVNGNRLQNDLDAYSPMIRDSGPQFIGGIKTAEKPIVMGFHEGGSNNQRGWRKLMKSVNFANTNEENMAIFEIVDNAGYYGKFVLNGRSGNLKSCKRIIGDYPVTYVKVSKDNEGYIIWCYQYRPVITLIQEIHTGRSLATFEDTKTISTFEEPTTDSYTQVITAEANV